MIMTKDVNVVLADMPVTIPAYSIANQDMSYTVVINARLNYERQLDAYYHEMSHIEGGDFDRKCSVDVLECYAHALMK